MDKLRIKQTMPHDSSGTRKFSDTKDLGKIQTGSPQTGVTNAGGVG